MAAFAALVTCRAIYEATGSIAAGLLGGGALALVYQAGREVGGEIANAHLTYFVASVVVITTGWLGRPVGRLDLALVALYGLSSAFAPLLVPLAIVTALLRASRWRAIIAIVVVAALLQVTVAVLMPRAEAPREVGSLVAYLDGYLDVIRSGPFGGLRVPSDRLVAVGIAVVLAVLAACWLLRDRAPGGGPGPARSVPSVSSWPASAPGSGVHHLCLRQRSGQPTLRVHPQRLGGRGLAHRCGDGRDRAATGRRPDPSWRPRRLSACGSDGQRPAPRGLHPLVLPRVPRVRRTGLHRRL